MTLQTCLQQVIFIYWPQFHDTRQGLAHQLLSEPLSLFSFIFTKNLAQVASCRAWLMKFRAGSFLKLKFYRLWLSEQFADAPGSISAAGTLFPQLCLQPPRSLGSALPWASLAGASAPVCLLLHLSTPMLLFSFGFQTVDFVQPGLWWLFMPSLRGECIYQLSWQQV